jgi:cytochrome c oxidase subunit 1
MLLLSAVRFVMNLLYVGTGRTEHAATFDYALAAHPPHRVPAALNGFFLWNVLVLILMAAAYGFPIAHVIARDAPQAVVHPLGRD